MKKLFYCFGIFSLILWTACNRDDESPRVDGMSENDQSVVEDQATGEAAFEDGESMAFSSMASGRIGGRIMDDRLACAEVDFNLQNLSLSIDFGAGCTGEDGIERKGKMTITYSSLFFFLEGSIITITFEDFSSQGFTINGSRSMKNISGGFDPPFVFEVSINEGSVTWPDGSTFIITAMEQIRTYYTDMSGRGEGHITITGTTRGVSRVGTEFTSTIEEELRINEGCIVEGLALPVSGSRVITRPQLPEILVDFGEGDCNNEISVEIEGQRFQLKVSKNGIRPA